MTKWARRKREAQRREQVKNLESVLASDQVSFKRPRSFTPEQDAFIRGKYRELSLRDLAVAFREKFGPIKTEKQIRIYTRNHGIKSGRTGCFAKGQTPWNQGKTGYMGANVTSFRKGRLPHNKRRLWTERVGKDGYVEISVPEQNPHTGHPTRYKHKHLWLWEVQNGPLPKGCAVIFKDGDIGNFDPDNLEMVSRSELLSLNLHGYKKMPEELRPTVMVLAKMEAKAGVRSRPGRGREERAVNS